jgi:ATP-dependent helicase HepA
MMSRDYDEVLAKMKAFLAAELPFHSSRWASVLVEPHIRRSSWADEGQDGASIFDSMDLAAVLKVAEKNWSTIAHRHHFPLRAFNLIKCLQSARNDYAHRSCDVIDIQWEQYDRSTMDLLFRYLDEAMLDLAA